MPEMLTRSRVKKMNGPEKNSHYNFSDIDAYNTAREALVEEERYMGFNKRAIQSSSSLEKHAAAIVLAVKENDEVTIYKDKTNSHGMAREMGDHFLGNIDLINQTELLKVAQHMPKGSHLHCHFNACLHPSFLVHLARGMKTMYIRSTLPLTTTDAFDKAEISFQVLPLPEKLGDLFLEDYEKQTWMSYPKFCAKYEGGVEAAEDWLVKKMLFTEEEVHDIHQTCHGIWDGFSIKTRMMKGLFGYESAYRAYTKQVIQSFVDDNIQYAEVRPNFPANVLTRDDGASNINNEGLCELIIEETEAKILSLKKANVFFGGMKVIYCCPRSFERKIVKKALDECISLKKKFPKLICGFDLVGPEDRGHPIKFFLEELLEFRAKCEEENLDIPFIFHAGETLDHGGPTDGNLFDAILLNSKRIGHGFALAKHPLLMEMFRDRKIALEVCPISNEILHLCPTIACHSLPTLLANDVPCTLNCDNSTYYSSTLSHDFYQVMIGSQEMSLHGWRVLAEWSIEYSCMDKSERSRVTKNFTKKWNEFCQWIIDEYGVKYPGASKQTRRLP